jgi:hypothetical protein
MMDKPQETAMKPVLLALAAAAVLVAPTVQASSPAYGAVAASPDAKLPAAACIRPGDIVNSRLGRDRHSLYLLVNGRGTYRLEVSGACLKGASRIDPVSIRSADGFSRACRPRELAVDISKGGVRPCFLQSIALLTPAQARALPKNERP